MNKKSLLFGSAAAALALLVIFALAGCSNPSSGSTEYVTQASSDYPYPADTVAVGDRAALDGLLNDYTAETNGVRNIAYTAATASFGGDLIIPTGKTVYLTQSHTSVSANITVTEGAKLVLVGEYTAGSTGLLLVKGTVEVFRGLEVTTDARDVADYTVENTITAGRNTVIGKNVTVLPGATLTLKNIDIIPPNQHSENKFTPAEAWAAAGQGHLTIDDPLNAYPYTVKELLTGVAPSATRWYTVESGRTASETLPAVIPLGAWITTSATPEESDGNTLTVYGSLETNGTLKYITEITVGNGAGLELSQASGDVLDTLTKLTVGPGASFEVASPNVTLQSLETLFLGDGSAIDVSAGNSVTFTKEVDKKLVTTLGKKVLYQVGTAADAVVDVAISDDASLISGSTLTVNPGSTFTLAAGKTLTVENGATVDFSALTPPAAATDPAPVTIDGTITIEEGGEIIGPALVDFEATPEALFNTIKLVDAGKVVLNWGATYTMGTGNNEKPYIGPVAVTPTYVWTAGGPPNDGAQIEINAAGLIIRDTNGNNDAVVTIDNTRAVILKDQSLTLDTGVTLDIANGNTLWLVGDTEANGGGAILKGAGYLVVKDTTIVGGPYGWQAVGDSIGIYVNSTESRILSGSAIATNTTPTATLRALGTVLGATITQAAEASNNLTIAARTTIALGGVPLKKVGEIVLEGDGSNPGKITFTDDTSKITTGNSSATTTTPVVLAADGVTDVTAGVISKIGVAGLAGDGTNAKAATTATVNTTDNDLISEGKLASLSGKDTSTGGTVSGPASDTGTINSETTTAADTTT